MSDERRPGDRCPERGSVLALVPAGFLILMLLGAIAVDNGATYLGQRQLQASVEAAANDAAGAALSNQAFYDNGSIAIDPTSAATVVCADLVAQHDDRLQATTVAIAIDGPAVFVEARAEVPAVFGRIIPGFSERPVLASASAIASQGANQQPLSSPPASAYTELSC
jgi:uncharacterized membrane protein